MHSHLHTQIKDLRAQNLQKIMESVLLMLAALFTTAVLPSLLARYAFSQEELMTQPVVFELIPLVSYVIAIAYFLYAVVGNFRRGNEIKTLKMRADNLGTYGDEMAEELVTTQELEELERIVEDAIKEVEKDEKKTAAQKKSSSKKSSKSKAKAKSSSKKKSSSKSK